MKKKKPMRRLMGDVMKLWYLYIPSVLATLAYTIPDILVRKVMGEAVDAVLLFDESFWFKFGIIVVVPLAIAPFHTISMLTKFGMSERLTRDMRIAIGKKSTVVAIPALEKNVSGDIMTHLGEEMDTLGGFVGYGLSEVTTLFGVGLGTICFMAAVDGALTLLFICLAFAVLPVSLFLARRVKKNEKSMRDALGKAQGIAGEGLHALRVVKSFRLEEVMSARYWKALGEALAADMRNLMVILRMEAAGKALGYIPMIIMIVAGTLRIADGTLTTGNLLSLAMLSNGFVEWLTQAPGVFTYIQRSLAACARVYEFLDLPEEKGGLYVKPDEGAPVVSFTAADFAYTEEKPVLRNLSFTVGRGEVVALVGESGSGKSTALKLICGFLQPTAGSVSVMGGDVSQWALGPLRKELAYVTQDSYLFPGSIKNNLLAAKGDATQEELTAVCKRAGILSFVEERGWDADVGERGGQLSGGERQRLSIARALLKNAPLLLLDEPTASLDAAAEHMVQQGLAQLMEGRTTLVVAHRLATIRRADRILVLDQGTIAAQGTHEELLQGSALYRSLVERQLMEGAI